MIKTFKYTIPCSMKVDTDDIFRDIKYEFNHYFDAYDFLAGSNEYEYCVKVYINRYFDELDDYIRNNISSTIIDEITEIIIKEHRGELEKMLQQVQEKEL